MLLYNLLKKIGLVFLSVLLILYIGFLVIIPFAVKPETYKSDIQKIVKESCGLNFDFQNAKILTTPMLGIGIKAEDITLSLPKDTNCIFKTQNFTVKISIPSLLFKTLKVTSVNITSPEIAININSKGSQYEIVEYLEEFFKQQQNNKNQEEVTLKDKSADTSSQLDFKIKVNKLKIFNYIVKIHDKKTKKDLTLNGDDLFLSFDGKHLHVKSNPKLLYNNFPNIVANLDIKTYIPDVNLKSDNSNTTSESQFINIVDMYGKYNLKSNISTKLIIEEDKNTPKINGNIYITDTTLNISGIQIPKSYLKLDFKGNNVNIDTNICITESEKAKIKGSVQYDKNFKTDLSIKTDKIYLASVIKLSKALLDSLNIQNSLKTLNAKGYVEADVKFNTDLNKIKSAGKIILANGFLQDSSTGLILNNMKSNLIFDNNAVNIENTEISVNGTPFKAEGNIKENSDTDIKIYTKNLPISALYATFAPSDIKKNYTIKNGLLSLDIILNGKLRSIAPKIRTEIINLVVKDKINNIDITNGLCNINIDTDLKTYNGKINNTNLVISVPNISSIVRNANTAIDFNEKTITINPSNFVLNGVSSLNIDGIINNYIKNPEIEIKGNGNIRAIDIKNLAGKDSAPFIKSSGVIPVKLLITGNDKKQEILFRAFGNANEYVTPIDFQELAGKQSTLQVLAEITNNTINLKQTGLYKGAFTDIKKENTGSQIAAISGAINLDKNITIDNLKITTNGNRKASICAFKNSSVNANTDIVVSGTITKPIIKGIVKIESLNIPEIHTEMLNGDISLNGDSIGFNLDKLNLNGTTISIKGTGILDYKPIFTISDLKIASDYLNSDKAIQVTEYMAKVPALNSGTNANSSMPVKITSGSINMKKLSSGDIIAENITGNLTLFNDIVYIKGMEANAFDGKINGDISMNLITSAITAKVSGLGMNADKTVTTCAGMKNTIFGTLGFNADINLKGATYIEQMKSLNGKADFNITKGQFGTLGRFETFLKADNLGSIAFVTTKIGSIVNTVSPHNTASFEKLDGNVNFRNGLMTISPISSTGKNMSLYITGNMNLVNNNANLLVLGRISEEIADLLGPLEQLNPVKLLEKSDSTWAVLTLGILNAVNESMIPSEINKIPKLTPSSEPDTTSKFVVKINGNVEKPQSAVKSFKWISSQTDLNKAKSSLSPVDTVKNVINTIPKTKEEAVNTIKEKGKNTLLNIGKDLLSPLTDENVEQKEPQE
ncbi:AsmA family protein [bacterium]|nr:AsmA family protein [bacterium]